MNDKPQLQFSDYQAIADAAAAYAQSKNFAVTIAVTDDGGHLRLLHRLDGANALSAQIAPDKARLCALSGKPSKIYEDLINQGRTAFLSAPVGGLLEGGLPIVVRGQCVGAIGVSGVQSADDARIAQAGIDGFKVD